MGCGPAIRGELLDELHMSPGRGGKLAGVIVAVAGPVEPVRGELIPLFTRNLARLAADADRGVGVEARGRMGLRNMTAPERPGEAIEDRRQRADGRVAGLRQLG